MNVMQNKKMWFSDAIFVDHVLELRKSNQRGEGLNKDWDPGSMGNIAEGMRQGASTVTDALQNPHLAAPAAALAATGAFQAGKQLYQGAKNVAGKVRDAIKPKELGEDEKNLTPPGYAPRDRSSKVIKERPDGSEKDPPWRRRATRKVTVPVDTKPDTMAASFAGMGGVRKSFFTSAVYPEEVGRQDNYSLRKSEMTQEPEYVEAPKRPVLAKPTFFETAVWPHEAGHADHYLRKGIVPLDRFGFRKAKEGWEAGPPVDPEAEALNAHRMGTGEDPGTAPFVPTPAADGKDPRAKAAAKAAEHFDSLLDHATVQNHPDSSPRERHAAAERIGDSVFKMKKLLPHMNKKHIASLITALKNGDMGALDDIRMNLGLTDHRDDPDQGAYYPDKTSQ